jgi:hypothetical protein
MPDGSLPTGAEAEPTASVTDTVAERRRLAEELQRGDASQRLEILRSQLAQERSVGLEGIQKRTTLLRDIIRGNITAEKDQEALLTDLDAVHSETLADMQTKEEINWMDRYAQQYLPYEWSTTAKQRTVLATMYGGAVVGVIAGWKLLKRLWGGTKKAAVNAAKQTTSGAMNVAKWVLIGTGIDHFMLGGRIRNTLFSLANGTLLADAAKEKLEEAKKQAGELVQGAKEAVTDTVDTARETVRTTAATTRDTVASSGAVERAKIAVATPLILRGNVAQADAANLDIYDIRTEENVAAVLQRMESSNVSVGIIQSILNNYRQPVDRGDALYQQLYATEDTNLTTLQRASLKRSCEFVVASFEKHQSNLQAAHSSLPEPKKPFDQMTILEAMNLLAESPLNLAQRFGGAVVKMVENPAARTEILKQFLEEAYETREFVTAEFTEWMRVLTPEEQMTVRSNVLSTALGTLGIAPLSSAPTLINGLSDLNAAEKKLLTAIITEVQEHNPTKTDGVVARAMEGDEAVLQSLERIWKEDLRLKDALQIHYLLRKAEQSGAADIALRLKMLHLLSRYDRVSYGRAGGQLAGSLIEKTLGVATGAINIEDVPPGIRQVVELAAREAKNKGEDWLAWAIGLLTTTPGLIISGIVALRLRLYKPANAILSSPLALHNWQRSADLRFLRYRRKAMFLWLRTEPRSLSEIEQRFRVPASVAAELQTLADQFADKQQKVGTLFRQTRMNLLIRDTLLQIGERRYSWLKSETDTKKIAQIYGLVTPDGKYDLKGAEAIQQHIATTEAQRRGRASKKDMQRAVTRIDRFADLRQKQLQMDGIDLTQAVSVTGEVEQETVTDTDTAADTTEPQATETDTEPDVAAADLERANSAISLLQSDIDALVDAAEDLSTDAKRNAVRRAGDVIFGRLEFVQGMYGHVSGVNDQCDALMQQLEGVQEQVSAAATAVPDAATEQTDTETEQTSEANTGTQGAPAEAAPAAATQTSNEVPESAPAPTETAEQEAMPAQAESETKASAAPSAIPEQWQQKFDSAKTLMKRYADMNTALTPAARRSLKTDLSALRNWLNSQRQGATDTSSQAEIDAMLGEVNGMLTELDTSRKTAASTKVEAAQSADIANIPSTQQTLRISPDTRGTDTDTDSNVNIRGRR